MPHRGQSFLSLDQRIRLLSTFAQQFMEYTLSHICDWLWQKQAVGLKISFVHFSLGLINNNFLLKCWKNYYSIFMGSRDMNFIMLFYSEVQFSRKTLAKFNDINRNLWQCMCIQP